MTRFYSSLFLCTSAVVAASFWQFFGRTLCYIVYYDREHGWTEDFAISTRICITIAVAVLIGALVTWLVYAYRHDYSSATFGKGESEPKA